MFLVFLSTLTLPQRRLLECGKGQLAQLVITIVNHDKDPLQIFYLELKELEHTSGKKITMLSYIPLHLHHKFHGHFSSPS